jgi:hypothetical protein
MTHFVAFPTLEALGLLLLLAWRAESLAWGLRR